MTNEEFIKYFKKNFRRTSSFFSGVILALFDAAALLLSIGVSFFIVNAINTSFINFRSFVLYSIFLPLILLVFHIAGLYPGIMLSPAEEVKRIFFSTLLSFAGIAVAIFIDGQTGLKDSVFLAIAFFIAIPIACLFVLLARHGARKFFGKFRFWALPCVIYTSGKTAAELCTRMLLHGELGYRPCMVIAEDAKKIYENAYSPIPLFKPTKEILQIIKKFNIKLALIADYEGDAFDIMQGYRYTVHVSKNASEMFSGEVLLKDIAGFVGFASVHELTKITNRALKRVFDICFALLLLPFVLLVSIPVCFIIKLSSPGPIFYGHVRIGKNRKPFSCLKFRSMYKDADEKLKQLLQTNKNAKHEWEENRKLKNDPRITKIGAFIRKTSIDELPQIINVLKGDMSFIGPRPVTKDELEKYGSKADFILSVLPGISGMWQTSGRSESGYEDRIALDLYYIQNWSIWLDVWLSIKTFFVVILGKGAY